MSLLWTSKHLWWYINFVLPLIENTFEFLQILVDFFTCENFSVNLIINIKAERSNFSALILFLRFIILIWVIVIVIGSIWFYLWFGTFLKCTGLSQMLEFYHLLCLIEKSLHLLSTHFTLSESIWGIARLILGIATTQHPLWTSQPWCSTVSRLPIV